MADLRTNYKDDVLDASVNEKRKYNMIQNADGTVSFDDVTTYTQNGDSFGAKDVNDTNTAVNELNNNLKQTTIIPEEGIELSTIDEKLNYIIENGTASVSLYNFGVTKGISKSVTVDIDLTKKYLIFVALCTGGAEFTINALRFSILDKGVLVDNHKGSQTDTAMSLSGNTLTFKDATSYGTAYCIYEM